MVPEQNYYPRLESGYDTGKEEEYEYFRPRSVKIIRKGSQFASVERQHPEQVSPLPRDDQEPESHARLQSGHGFYAKTAPKTVAPLCMDETETNRLLLKAELVEESASQPPPIEKNKGEEKLKRASGRRPWILDSVVEAPESLNEFCPSLTLDQIDAKIEFSVAPIIAGFLNARLDGSVIFGCYGVFQRLVKGIAYDCLAQEQDFKVKALARLRRAFGEAQSSFEDFVSVEFCPVFPPPSSGTHSFQAEDESVKNLAVVEFRVNGGANSNVFRLKTWKRHGRTINGFPWRRVTPENSAFTHWFETEEDILRSRECGRRNQKEMRALEKRIHQVCVPDAPPAVSAPGPTETSPISQTRRPIPMQFFVHGDPSPFFNNQTTIVHRELFLDKVMEDDLAPSIVALFNSNVSGTIIFGIFKPPSSLNHHQGARIEGVKISRDERDSFRLSIDQMVLRLKPMPNPRLFQVYFHPIVKRTEPGRPHMVLPDTFIVRLEIQPHDSENFFETVSTRRTEISYPVPVAFTDAREVERRRRIYIRVGDKTLNVTVDEVLNKAVEQRNDEWRSLLSRPEWKRRLLLYDIGKTTTADILKRFLD